MNSMLLQTMEEVTRGGVSGATGLCGRPLVSEATVGEGEGLETVVGEGLRLSITTTGTPAVAREIPAAWLLQLASGTPVIWAPALFLVTKKIRGSQNSGVGTSQDSPGDICARLLHIGPDDKPVLSWTSWESRIIYDAYFTGTGSHSESSKNRVREVIGESSRLTWGMRVTWGCFPIWMPQMLIGRVVCTGMHAPKHSSAIETVGDEVGGPSRGLFDNGTAAHRRDRRVEGWEAAAAVADGKQTGGGARRWAARRQAGGAQTGGDGRRHIDRRRRRRWAAAGGRRWAHKRAGGAQTAGGGRADWRRCADKRRWAAAGGRRSARSRAGGAQTAGGVWRADGRAAGRQVVAAEAGSGGRAAGGGRRAAGSVQTGGGAQTSGGGGGGSGGRAAVRAQSGGQRPDRWWRRRWAAAEGGGRRAAAEAPATGWWAGGAAAAGRAAGGREDSGIGGS
ncbi:hypothetical protein GGX14DRAFT_393999 [Mycena pura]|uniref:Uncharacterized protein n=1 Tax=Mycena pura TaxID=153505 RepID=A0AAD6VN68_9AGAR|nr:hypothetical protein GGX14DRAFT_393999 [Mycena pura]